MESPERNENCEITNFVTDENLTKEFFRIARPIAFSLHKKYYSLFQYITEEDLVMECWNKILKRNIFYDSSRGCKFNSFVMTLVTCQCIDLFRKYKKRDCEVSLEETFNAKEGAKELAFVDLISDFSVFNSMEEIEFEDIVDSCDRDYNTSNFKEIYKLKKEGYSNTEIAKKLNVKTEKVKDVIKTLEPVFMSRLKCENKTLEDILYGDEDSLYEHKEQLIHTLTYVKSDNSINLSKLITYIIKGYSYKQLQDCFGLSVEEIKNFLSKYEKLRIDI